MNRILFSFALTVLFVLGSCGDKDEPLPPLDIPTSFDAAGYASGVTSESAVRSQLFALSSVMKAGRTAGVSVAKSDMVSAYTTGTPSLEGVTSMYYDGKINGVPSWFSDISFASGETYTPGGSSIFGGVFGGYLFDDTGLEIEQIVEKGLFGAALYNHALTVMNGSLDVTTAARVVEIFGSNPDFPNSDNGDNVVTPDVHVAKYAARRDKNDGNGLYSQMKLHLITLQAAIAAGEGYEDESAAAIANIKLTWEKIHAATAINYCQATLSKLTATNPSEADQASALHSYAEAVGFMHGFYEISEKQITDAQLAEILTLMNTPISGPASSDTSEDFVTDPANQLPKLIEVIDNLQTIYGFSDQEIEDFKKNWVSEQGR